MTNNVSLQTFRARKMLFKTVSLFKFDQLSQKLFKSPATALNPVLNTLWTLSCSRAAEQRSFRTHDVEDIMAQI